MNKHNTEFNSFLKQQGVILPHLSGSYDPISGHYIYGPLGKKIKLQLESYIRNFFDSLDYDEIDTPLIYPKSVWINSGHWNKFSDPIIYTKNGNCFRLDKEIEEQFPEINYGTLSKDEILNLAKKLKPIGDDIFVVTDEIQYKDLMMKTYSGNVECALRPETATTTYTSFDDLYNYNNKILPMKVYQIGKAFRNEISPRNGIIRCREFTQAEGHIFVQQTDKDNCDLFDENKKHLLPILINGQIITKSLEDCYNKKLFNSKYYAWLICAIYKLFVDVLPIDKIRLRQHAENEKSFYALDAWDIEVNLSDLGWTEICGIHDRGNYDLTQHKPTTKMTNIPHILELAIGVDRFMYALLDTYYDKKEIAAGKTILKLPHILAPIRFAVFSLVKNKKELVDKAKEVYKIIKQKYPNSIFDLKQSIGKRYLKYGIMGVPTCITIDHDTLVDNTVTLRDRDTENQVRINIIDLMSL